MKKTLGTVLAITIVAVAMFGAVGSVYAMADTGKGPGNGESGAGAAGVNSTSVLSDYMVDAMADALGIDATTLAARLDAGETFYDIALAEGYTTEAWAELFANVQAAATEAATADGLTPQMQLNTNTASQLQTNTATQDQLNDGTCDGTGDCLDTDAVPNLYSGTNAGTRGRRSGMQR